MLGAVVLSVLQSVVIWRFSAKWGDMVAFALLLAVLLFRRTGLLGIALRTEEQ